MINIKNLSKSYDGKVIFTDFNLSFTNGIYAIMGESGIGKTTLLRIIAGLDRNYTGEVTVDGKISVAFQEHRLFPALSAIDNVTLKSEEKLQSAAELLKQMNYSENDFSLLPEELSGGMRQRISLARAILHPTDILLLDEPTKELDEQTANSVLKIIKAQAKERLVIVVTHNISDAIELGAEIINL